MDHSDAVKRIQNPRENANPLSLITFLYTRRLFVRGFKKDLEDDDLYEVISSCRSKRCADKLEHAYQIETKKKEPSVIRILWHCYGLVYVVLGIFNLSFKLLTSTLEPDAIAHLVGYFKPGQTKMTLNDALYYSSVLIVLKLIHTAYHPNYSLYLAQLSIQIRTSFCSLIYRKALKLSPKALEKTSLGNIITIISKDVSMFEGAIMLFNDLWIGVVQTFYICYLIYAKVGISSTLGVLILASAIPIQFYISKIIANLRLKINKKTDVRLQESQEALSTIKIIKMYTWEMIFTNRISETRRKEVNTMMLKSITRLGLIVTSDFLGKVGFYVIVMFYIYLNSSVDAESIFYIMKLYATLKGTISMMFTFGLTLIAELSASLSRINTVLMLEELPDHMDKPDDEPQIDIRDASVNLKDVDVLKHISFKLKAGLNVITGQLGCGKTSLIKLILRDLPADSGDIRTRGRMSYASQDPWLFPATIKQNILFGEKYEYERYNKVLEACALTYDLGILEKGDETIVQDRGMNLSKGQQARVNLARAVYKESDIYLLDDALTALDSKVQEHIFRECIEKFLKGKLIILVTHNSRHINRSEKVIILQKGRVNYFGKHQDLSHDILQALEEEGHEHEQPPPTPLFEDKSKEITEETIAEHTKLLKPPPVIKHKQIYHEVKKSGGVAFDVYASYVRYGGGLLVLLIMISLYFCSTFSESSSQVMLTNWVNHESKLSALREKHFGNSTVDIDKLMAIYFPTNSTNITEIETDNGKSDMLSNVDTVHPNLPNPIHGPSRTIPLIPARPTSFLNDSLYMPVDFSSLTEEQNKTYHLLLEMGIIELQATKSLNLYTIALIASIVFEFVKNYMVFNFGTKASINLHKAMIKSIVFAKMSFFDTFFVGNILNRFSQDLSIVDEYLPIIITTLIGAGFGVVGIVGMMAHVNLKFLAPALAVLVLLILMRFIYMPTARSLKRLEAATRSPIIGHLNSSMEGLTTVRAYKAQEILRNEFDKHQDVYTSARYTSLCARNAFSFYMDFSAVLLNIFIIGRFLFFDTDTLAGDVGLTLTQASALTMVLQFALMQWSEAENLMTSVERVMEYTKVEPERTDGQETPNWPNKGEILYKGVSLTYTNSTEKVLKDINFKAESNEKIGIVGRTGAGKSSIISTLFRLYDHEGTITIDGIDTRTLSLKYLRQHISIIPQDPIMFSGTIRTNIDPLKEFTDEEIWRVLHKVNLDNKVANLECVCEDTNFSSGERQLLSLSRAIIRRNKIVVLDEATANMDPETEQMVQKAIDSNFSTCTVFIIAHRIDCILNCNKVMVLNRGEIMEFDDPKTLLLDKNSMFSKIVKVAGTMGN